MCTLHHFRFGPFIFIFLVGLPTVVQKDSWATESIGQILEILLKMNRLGLVLLFFVDKEPMLLFPAIPCLGAGGFTLLTSNFQLAMLTNIAGLVVLAIQAGFGASGTIFRVFFSGK